MRFTIDLTFCGNKLLQISQKPQKFLPLKLVKYMYRIYSIKPPGGFLPTFLPSFLQSFRPSSRPSFRPSSRPSFRFSFRPSFCSSLTFLPYIFAKPANFYTLSFHNEKRFFNSVKSFLKWKSYIL